MKTRSSSNTSTPKRRTVQRSPTTDTPVAHRTRSNISLATSPLARRSLTPTVPGTLHRHVSRTTRTRMIAKSLQLSFPTAASSSAVPSLYFPPVTIPPSAPVSSTPVDTPGHQFGMQQASASVSAESDHVSDASAAMCTSDDEAGLATANCGLKRQRSPSPSKTQQDCRTELAIYASNDATSIDAATANPMNCDHPAHSTASPSLCGFHCPFDGCSRRHHTFMACSQLVSHLMSTHKDCLADVPQAFWDSIQRRFCSKCARVVCLNRSCTCPPLVAATDLPQCTVDQLRAVWDQMVSSRCGVLSHVPKPVRFQFATLLTSAVRSFNDDPSEEKLYELLLLIRLVLRTTSRGGKKNGRCLTSILLARMDTWKAGRLRELVPQAPSAHRPRSKRTHISMMDQIKPAVDRALADGALSKAAQIVLQSTDRSTSCNDVSKMKECMESLHPKEDQRNLPPPPHQSAVDSIEVTAESIRKAVKSFPLGSSGGPSGLRPAHLSECLDSQAGASLAEALATFVERSWLDFSHRT